MKKRNLIAALMTGVLALSLAAGIGAKPTSAKAKIVLDEDDGEMVLEVGKTATVSLLNVPVKSQKKVKWITAKKTVATVKAKKINNTSAKISAVGVGKTTISAKLSGKKYSCTITVVPDGYPGIDVASPDWVTKLPQAATAQKLFIVAAPSKTATTAWLSLHEKQTDGTWHMRMTSPGFIGLNGLDKTKEGDAKTPTGEFKFNRAFGIADDPGCAIPYVKVDENTYWSGDPNYQYNQLVDLSSYPNLAMDDSEHIIDYKYQYQYCLNISYNEAGTPGLGSAIFLHCFGGVKPWTGGCVAMPEDRMKFIMQNVDSDTVVLIDTYDNLSGGADWPSSTWP
ncbi:MAG: L,D-transpeptidase family protein [Eubacterium sp.]|nr:L,D-transpeptidase family protein [Eubacterium sp.]